MADCSPYINAVKCLSSMDEEKVIQIYFVDTMVTYKRKFIVGIEEE
jgi:hypothetical protein